MEQWKNEIFIGMSGGQFDFLAKVILIGDSGVGKTNLLLQLCEGLFQDSYVATLGVDFKLHSLELDGHRIKLQIWDTAGQERFRNITQTYFRGAAGIVLVYAVNSRQSFSGAAAWFKQIESSTEEGVSKVLVGAKSDLEGEREVGEEEGRELAGRHGMGFLEASAKTGSNVREIFLALGRQMLAGRAAGCEKTSSVSLHVESAAKSCQCWT